METETSREIRALSRRNESTKFSITVILSHTLNSVLVFTPETNNGENQFKEEKDQFFAHSLRHSRVAVWSHCFGPGVAHPIMGRARSGRAVHLMVARMQKDRKGWGSSSLVRPHPQ